MCLCVVCASWVENQEKNVHSTIQWIEEEKNIYVRQKKEESPMPRSQLGPENMRFSWEIQLKMNIVQGRFYIDSSCCKWSTIHKCNVHEYGGSAWK